ncbi:MAG: MFS transporter [Sphingomonas sp.]|uniref:MFS transporter n=1 Tax=Sphingomonas sp. TaxID=28214 RepID=UPI001B05CDC7|nr:MFS transporter [Sphingomonas sp.]MBO9621541.1 MFS transporter [Sphingomonas sp.]
MTGSRDDRATWPIATWLALASLALGSFAVVSSELLPMGVLPPLARDLGVSEGVAGQTVTMTALFAGLAAPSITLIIGRTDRKYVMLAVTGLVVASNLLAVLSSGFWGLLGARVILGLAIGGFFALAGATIARLVAMESFGSGMGVVFVGISLATVVAPPLGALASDAWGWRAAFLGAAGIGLAAVALQGACLPRVPAAAATSPGALVGLVRRPSVRLGLVAGLLVVGGHFAGFTFLRPWLQTGAGLRPGAVAAILLVYGIANIGGSALAGLIADRRLQAGFTGGSFLLGASATGLVLVGAAFFPAMAFAALWGLAFGAAPVLIQTWMGRAAPDQMEAVGGLFLGVLQFSIALGAIAGGSALDMLGVRAPFLITAGCGVLAALLVLGRVPAAPQATATAD